VLGRDEMTLQVSLTGKVNLAQFTPKTRQKCKERALILAQVTTSFTKYLSGLISILDPDPGLFRAKITVKRIV
jgi:hypothetical protein